MRRFRPIADRASFGIGKPRAPVQREILRGRHPALFRYPRNLLHHLLPVFSGAFVPLGEVHCGACTQHIALHEPRGRSDVRVQGKSRFERVAIRALGGQDVPDSGWHPGRTPRGCMTGSRAQSRVAEGMNQSKQERCRQSSRAEQKHASSRDHDCSASEESTIARWPGRATYFASVIPSTLRSLPAGTVIGPGCGADPGAGWGNAVEAAVWNVT